MRSSNTKTVGSVVSELKASLRNVLAWYGTLVRILRTFKQRTNVPYSQLHKKRIPHKHITVLFSKNLGVPYSTYVSYRTAFLAHYTLTIQI